MRERGPSSLITSFRFCVSVLFIAPVRGAVVAYAVRKIVVPMISFIQLGRLGCDVTV